VHIKSEALLKQSRWLVVWHRTPDKPPQLQTSGIMPVSMPMPMRMTYAVFTYPPTLTLTLLTLYLPFSIRCASAMWLLCLDTTMS
jgi:hypothetical protein